MRKGAYPQPATPRRIIREGERYLKTGVSPAQWWRYEQAGRAPRRFKLIEGGRACGWYEDEIDQWIAERRKSTVA